jgi:hypothetical protein
MSHGGHRSRQPGMTSRVVLRSGLILLAVLELAIGVWQYVFPSSFFDDFPTVALDPPYNEHLMSDVGGLTLSLAVVVAVAAVRLERGLVTAAFIGFTVFAVSHLVFHLLHFDGFTTREAMEVGWGLGVEAALPIALLFVARRIH